MTGVDGGGEISFGIGGEIWLDMLKVCEKQPSLSTLSDPGDFGTLRGEGKQEGGGGKEEGIGDRCVPRAWKLGRLRTISSMQLISADSLLYYPTCGRGYWGGEEAASRSPSASSRVKA